MLVKWFAIVDVVFVAFSWCVSGKVDVVDEVRNFFFVMVVPSSPDILRKEFTPHWTFVQLVSCYGNCCSSSAIDEVIVINDETFDRDTLFFLVEPTVVVRLYQVTVTVRCR